MIIKCDLSYQTIIEQYIGLNYPECLYLYLDFKKFGFDVEYVNIWIQKNTEKITAVILQYRTGMHIYSRAKDYESDEIVKLIKQVSPDMICARDSIIRDLYSTTIKNNYEVEYGNIGYCKAVGCESAINAKKVAKDDFKDIAKLLFQDEGIGASYDLEELGNQICIKYYRIVNFDKRILRKIRICGMIS